MKHRTRHMAYTALFAALIVLCSFIAVPTQPPFTMQTFAVFGAALCLGARRGAAAVGLYLALGAVGVPVFAGFGGGIGYLLGASGGFALGFLPAAWIAGRLAERGRGGMRILGCAAGLFICYTFGLLWYVWIFSRGSVGIGTAAAVCVLPFVIPDAIKIALALALSRIFARFIPDRVS